MPERVFCIDFGAAYTKVALRTGIQDSAVLVQLGPAGRDFWVPTVVAADWTNGQSKPELEFGEKAAGIKPGPKIRVFTNFKHDLFATAVAPKPALHPLDALLQSPDFGELAARHNVLPEAIAALRVMIQSARTMLGAPVSVEQADARKQEEAQTAAHFYFKWLHEQVMAACAKLPHTALNYREIPVRIAVPAFGSADQLDKHPGCVRLRQALHGTGWKLDERSLVSEPESNAVGVLTKASNLLTKKRLPNLGGMFDKGPLITVVKGDKHHTTYRALVIDVGAFTTDFGALQVKTDGKFVESTEAGWFSSVLHSVPFGVSDLDASIRAALTEDKREQLNGLAPRDFAVFQTQVYSDGASYRVGPGKVIGGPTDQSAVQKCLETFTARLAAETAAFLQQLGPASMQELILTGGGNNIPAVRDALITAAQATPGQPFVKIHAKDLKNVKGASQLVDSLKDHFARGASALGGASIYFEKAYY